MQAREDSRVGWSETLLCLTTKGSHGRENPEEAGASEGRETHIRACCASDTKEEDGS